ncbi:MAG: methyltransferase domain-containing protein [Candidatus Paceibacterota bacterium]|jgi:ubiquinone/menaquinone biosynthesis C-methylase UbiE
MFSDPEKNIEQFSLGKGNVVADFGAGSGFYSFAAAEAVGETGKVYAIDVQKDLLQKLKNEARNVRHLMNIEVVWADLEHLGGTKLRESSMDAVVAANLFFQIENKDNACMEIRRILKKNGRVLFVDWLGSFGGMGPHQSNVFPREAAEKLFEKHGFALEKETFSGGQHYGLIFRKV